MNQENWRTYEEVATFLLDQFAAEFGLKKFESKQEIEGTVNWEIDAKGVNEGGDLFIIVECRRYTTSKLSQEALGALAYRIKDTGADGGIIVSPLGLQKGAKKIAKAENIHNVILDAKSTPTEYFLKFLNKVKVGKHLQGEIVPSGKLTLRPIRKNGTDEEFEV
ncbi:MAG: restriction endonuclease [Anaerolineales bacterium]|nr:restriction endonuclease [Anaerolineales bacterium]